MTTYSADLIPTMTSETVPSGTVTKSSEYSSGYASWKAFDDDFDGPTGWITGAGVTTGFIQYQFTSGQVIAQYTITNDDSFTVRAADPVNWTFQGSNNGSSYTTLDTQTGQTFTSGVKKLYPISNTTSYTYYKIDITLNNGHTYVGFAEMEMMAVLLPSYVRNKRRSFHHMLIR